MNRITYITRSLASHALCTGRKLLTGATVVTFATLALASCNKDEAPNTGAFNPNATLSLSTATVEGLATRAGNTTTNRTVVDGFVDGDVIQIEYDFDGDYTTFDGHGFAYAKLSGDTWTIYADLNLSTVAKLRPNPNRPEESWEKLHLGFNFSTRGIVTDADGKKEYGATAVSDPVTNITTYYDALIANIRSTTPGTLKAKEFSVGTNGEISVCFAHERALLSLSESALIVGGYAEGYNGISALTGITEENSPGITREETIAFTLKPGTEPGKGTWQAISSTSYETLEETGTITLKSLTATLAKDGTPGTTADKITQPITTVAADGKPVALQSGTRYPLSLTLTPTHSNAAIKGAINGWDTEEKWETNPIEGVDYKLATAGDKSSDWTILTAGGLQAFGDHVNSFTSSDIHPNATLANNINLSTVCSQALGKSWTPIGGNSSDYAGIFDGAGHSISGLYINDALTNLPSESHVRKGLFGQLSSATVKNLTVKGSITIAATDGEGILLIYAGGITGSSGYSTLTNCHSEVEVIASGDSKGTIQIYAGGIIGTAANDNLSSCSSTGAVTATVSKEKDSESVSVGGICGSGRNLSLIGCKHTIGIVSATAIKGDAYVGGIVGIIPTSTNNPQLLGCTNTAEVKGSAGSALCIGGVTGRNHAEMVACSNSGAITYNSKGDLYAGGVVGVSNATVISSFSTTIPKVSIGGSAGSLLHIGGIMGIINLNTDDKLYPVNACFYVNDIVFGSNGNNNGIGAGNDDGLNNADGGHVANLAELNGKVNGMNTAINTYNTTPTGTAKPCTYRWAASTTGGAPTLSK